jgi:anaerobic sulfite reductase subunit B
MKNPYLPKKVKIISIKKETKDIKTFRVKYSCNHEPGEFVELSVPGIGECPISICSWSNKYLDLCIRNVGSVTSAIFNLKKNDYIWLRGIYGTGYPMKELNGKDIFVIGGGTGAAPLRGVVEYIKDNKKDFGNAEIILGFRDSENVLFKEDIKKWSKYFEVKVTVDKNDKKWKGNVGIITKLLEKLGPDKNSVAITCGPPIMIKFVIQKLKQRGFADNQIYVSFERLMHCGLGKCGHCTIEKHYVCRDGPVFRYDNIKGVQD